jgi:response regulator RpfG family c-di-GMP phosphodiesterase
LLNNCAEQLGVGAMYETVSVEQLFEEELEALEEQHQRLIDENTFESRHTAQKIANVIEYFKLRLGVSDETMDEVYGYSKNDTLH